ncbi:hypothetical protein JHU04_002479 [Brenneria sp. 4F2]|nr:hypothetical protein [Brenneria bubanii]
MNIELNREEIEELSGLIESAWLDGFDGESLETAFEKLKSALEGVE